MTKEQINLRFSYQLKQLSWTLLVLGFVVLQLKCMVFTAHAGLIWCIFPASMIMMNDTTAYFCGVALGNKFIKYKFMPYLSPKKTWEGFLGGGVCTLVYAFISVQYWGMLPLVRCSYPEIRAAQEHMLSSSSVADGWTTKLGSIGACQNDFMFMPDEQVSVTKCLF
jgi:phosphatidate cytidylyltransferase